MPKSSSSSRLRRTIADRRPSLGSATSASQRILPINKSKKTWASCHLEHFHPTVTRMSAQSTHVCHCSEDAMSKTNLFQDCKRSIG